MQTATHLASIGMQTREEKEAPSRWYINRAGYGNDIKEKYQDDVATRIGQNLRYVSKPISGNFSLEIRTDEGGSRQRS
jgi:hypothetical protein